MAFEELGERKLSSTKPNLSKDDYVKLHFPLCKGYSNKQEHINPFSQGGFNVFLLRGACEGDIGEKRKTIYLSVSASVRSKSLAK